MIFLKLPVFVTPFRVVFKRKANQRYRSSNITFLGVPLSCRHDFPEKEAIRAER
jgi:hypothetical protein